MCAVSLASLPDAEGEAAIALVWKNLCVRSSRNNKVRRNMTGVATCENGMQGLWHMSACSKHARLNDTGARTSRRPISFFMYGTVLLN